jgi:hypothetical protein
METKFSVNCLQMATTGFDIYPTEFSPNFKVFHSEMAPPFKFS